MEREELAMDSWENDWADPFSDEPLTAPPPKIERKSKEIKRSRPAETKKVPEKHIKADDRPEPRASGSRKAKEGTSSKVYESPRYIATKLDSPRDTTTKLASPRDTTTTLESPKYSVIKVPKEPESPKYLASPPDTVSNIPKQPTSPKESASKIRRDAESQWLAASKALKEAEASEKAKSVQKEEPPSRDESPPPIIRTKSVRKSKSAGSQKESAKKKEKESPTKDEREAGTSKDAHRSKSRKKPKAESPTKDIESQRAESPQRESVSPPQDVRPPVDAPRQKTKQKEKESDFSSFEHALAAISESRNKEAAENAHSYVADLFDKWLQKSPIRRMFRPSKIEETKVEILGSLIKELKQETIDELVVIYFEQANELLKQLNDEKYEAMWKRRISQFTDALIKAATVDYWNKLEGPGYRIVWAITERYHNEEMQASILKSLVDCVCNFPYITDFRYKSTAVPAKVRDFRASEQFLALNFVQVKELFDFLKAKLSMWDKLLLGLISWIYQDEALLAYQKGLSYCLMESRFSRNCMESLLANDDVNKSKKINSMLRAYSKEIDAKRRITIFSNYRIREDKMKDRKIKVEEGERCCCSQQFDLDSMTWLPLQILPVHKLSSFAMCQYEDHIVMVGGEPESEAMFLQYDVQENTIEFKGGTRFETNDGTSMGVFKGHLYLTEGITNSGAREAVYCRTPKDRWVEVQPLKHRADSAAVILTTTDKIYIIHGLRRSYADLAIDFNTFSKRSQPWESITKMPGDGRNLYGENFCILDNNLCCLYKSRLDLIEAWYDHTINSWDKRICAGMMNNIADGLGYRVPADIMRVCQYPTVQSNNVSVLLCIGRDTVDANVNVIPNVNWMWGATNRVEDILLPAQKGKREIGCNDTTKLVYTLGI